MLNLKELNRCSPEFLNIPNINPLCNPVTNSPGPQREWQAMVYSYWELRWSFSLNRAHCDGANISNSVYLPTEMTIQWHVIVYFVCKKPGKYSQKLYLKTFLGFKSQSYI